MPPIARKRLVLAGVTVIALAIAIWLCVILWGGYHGAGHPRKVTEVALDRIGVHLHDYQKRNGRFPSSQEGLKILYPNEGIAVLDGWGHAFIYRSNEKQEQKAFSLYSIGANGIDESGSGDDVDFWKLKD